MLLLNMNCMPFSLCRICLVYKKFVDFIAVMLNPVVYALCNILYIICKRNIISFVSLQRAMNSIANELNHRRHDDMANQSKCSRSLYAYDYCTHRNSNFHKDGKCLQSSRFAVLCSTFFHLPPTTTKLINFLSTFCTINAGEPNLLITKGFPIEFEWIGYADEFVIMHNLFLINKY